MLKIIILGTLEDKPYKQESSHFNPEDLMVPLVFVLSIIQKGCKLSKANITSIELYQDNILLKYFVV